MYTHILFKADDLDLYERWLKTQEVKFLGEGLKKPASIVEACQWLSSTKLLNEEFVKREKPLRTAIELCPDVPEIQSLQMRSKALKKQVDIYLAKVT